MAQPQTLTAWVQFGGEMVGVAVNSYERIRAALRDSGASEDALAELDARHEDYQRRIADAKARSGE
jgi:hypothetical protein